MRRAGQDVEVRSELSRVLDLREPAVEGGVRVGRRRPGADWQSRCAVVLDSDRLRAVPCREASGPRATGRQVSRIAR